MQTLINNGKMEIAMQYRAASSVNVSGTNGKIDTPLTQPGSGFDLGETRRQLIALRVKHGANSPIGHRCSNLAEMIQNTRDTPNFARKVLDASIMKQMAELQRLLQASQ